VRSNKEAKRVLRARMEESRHADILFVAQTENDAVRILKKLVDDVTHDAARGAAVTVRRMGTRTEAMFVNGESGNQVLVQARGRTCKNMREVSCTLIVDLLRKCI